MGFFIYGSGLVGRAARPPRAYAWLAGVVVLIAVERQVFDLPGFVLLFGGALSLLIGAVAIHTDELDRQESALKLSQAEVRRLAAVAQRERIGRDQQARGVEPGRGRTHRAAEGLAVSAASPCTGCCAVLPDRRSLREAYLTPRMRRTAA